jgi:hypothetical protein
MTVTDTNRFLSCVIIRKDGVHMSNISLGQLAETSLYCTSLVLQ